MWYLAADIGGTNSRLLAMNTQVPENAYNEVYPSEDYQDIIPIIENFKKKHAITEIQSACFAVAGPVQRGKAKITNLPWHLEEENIEQKGCIGKVSLVNDFIGVAHGIPVLTRNDYITLQAAEPDPHGTIGILGAGTGLGQAILAWHNGRRISIASEGGHVDFAPRDDEEIELLKYWQSRLGRVSYEALVSGPGLSRLFVFYSEYLEQPPDDKFNARVKKEDPAAVIVEYAQRYSHPVAQIALKRFITIYAAQAANLALTCKATGGVYLAGGIAPRIIKMLQSDDFINTFNDKHPMQALMACIPVRVIMNTNVGLLGALEIAKTQIEAD